MDIFAFHNSQDFRCRNPLGACKAGQSVTLAIKTDWQVMAVTLILYCPNHTHMEYMCYRDGGYWQKQIELPDTPGVLWYQFLLRCVDGTSYYYGCPAGKRSGVGALKPSAMGGFQLSVYQADFHTPSWFGGRVMYQIFPDRYAIGDPSNMKKGQAFHTEKNRSVYLHQSFEEEVLYTAVDGAPHYKPCDYFGGDLQGIRQNLPQLEKLGVQVLYLNPIGEADSNHRYNTGDYKSVDPFLGDNSDFLGLCTAAKERGMRVMLDGVYSHTGDDSVYFNKYGTYDSAGAYQGSSSPYYSWYKFGANRDDYQSWWGFQTLPEVDEHNPNWQNFIYKAEDSVFAHWVNLGASGYRLDVADEIPDDILQQMRQSLKAKNEDLVLLGEVWEDATTKENYGNMRTYALGGALDTVMNYPFRGAVIDFLQQKISAAALCEFFDDQKQNYPPQMAHCLMNLLSSHDVARIVTVLGSGTEGKELSREAQASFDFTPSMRQAGRDKTALAVALQFSIPGTPCIYYGDEYGMEGFSDPFNRRPLNKSYMGLYQTYQYFGTLRHTTSCLQNGHSAFLYSGEDCVGVLRFVFDGKDALGAPAQNGMVLTVVNRNRSEWLFKADLSQVQNGLCKEAITFLKEGNYQVGEDASLMGRQLEVPIGPCCSKVVFFKF